MNKKILWLASWYPNELSPYEGDFIQRHARAVSIFQEITVIHIKKDENGIITSDIKKMVTHASNLTEMIVYYHPVKTRLLLLNKLLSSFKYKKIYKAVLRRQINDKGKPDLVHVHVALKAGLQALWLKKMYNIPFIISEHWSGYLPGAKYGVNDLNIVKRKWIENLFNKAIKITTVSDVLRKAIQYRFGAHDFLVIPNVVDINLFYPIEHPENPIVQFIHISTLQYEKNFTAIINAFKIIKTKGFVFHLIVYGTATTEHEELVKESGLSEFVELMGEVPQALLAPDVQKADALILYSHYETFGCVVIEANACGVPAILSDLPVFKEFVSENVNGIFIKSVEPFPLAEILEKFIGGNYHFNKMRISQDAIDRFSYKTIGKLFYDLYKAV
ncbi:MAG: glycosyltransferase [Chitinophagaceae bacterium]|nr:glycosyltransferase [Chitinophagaceae bacterium]